ncbi:ABC transporter ATP-binding protein [Verrucomicrobiaceae bacterium N1E253]|uniref:ABC transporter ATP-binding protein n=2 Tax=Oceaniferula marina TaxID=2748318 RepID=A0A851GKV5_9BACT|nr:ABC transporter ATP-binding protein [Oceaniferula marina]
MEAIRVESIAKSFGKVQALNQASISIEQGELFFLLGSSGCGKTTLLRCIAGLETPDSGRILFGDRDVTSVPTHKREAAMVFQSYALWPHMSVGENIAFGLEERKIDPDEIDERVNEALSTVHLDGYADRQIDQLSGGQQQRVALARALVVRPACLLLDEPLSNLDAKLRTEMREEIRRIVKDNGLTAAYVTHDQEEALSMADRIAIIDQGHIEQVGTPEDIYRNPLSAHVASFVGKTNLLEAEVTRLVWDDDDDHLSVRVACPAGRFEGRITRRNWRPADGEKVFLSIRPEAFHPYHGGVPVNRLTGHVEDRTYLGGFVQYSIRGDGGHLWHVTDMNPHQMREIGEPVILSVDPSDVVILQS